MDIEQLKLIIDLVKDTSDSAVWLAILYFFLPLLKIILYFIGWVVIIPILIRGIRSLISHLTDEYLKEVRTVLDIGSPGEVVRSEAREIIAEVKRLKQLDKP